MIEIKNLPVFATFEGFTARFIHTEYMTLGYWDAQEGAKLPEHAHMHEQVTSVIEGKFELTVGGETHVYEPGMVAVIPPYTKHSGVALTPCKLFDIFSPVRQDYVAISQNPDNAI